MKNIQVLLILALVGLSWRQVEAVSSDPCDNCTFGIAGWRVLETEPNTQFFFEQTEALAITKIGSISTVLTTSTAVIACSYASTCGANSTCNSTYATDNRIFSCDCDAGYSADRETQAFACVEIDECLSNPCTTNANCTDAHLNFTCACDPGFTGDGYTNCTDIDECSPNPCADNATCTTPVVNSFMCACDPGYTGDGSSNCTDIDECASSTDDCHATWGTCTNNDGSFICACNNGFTGDGVNCSDIDECLDNTTCHADADCTNSNGSHSCVCKFGYSGDGSNCTDIVDCPVSIIPNAECIEGVNTSTIVCMTGYNDTNGNMTVCDDIDECASSPCDVNANCSNSIGSFSCTCNGPTWHGDGFTCSDRINTTVNFDIVCASYPFVSNLLNTSSVEHGNLRGALLTALENKIASIDLSANTICTLSFSNSTTGSTVTTGSCNIFNTDKTHEELEIALTALTETTTCGATLSTDECSNSLNNCGATANCVDTAFGFCCYEDLDYTASTSFNTTYDVNLANISSSQYGDFTNNLKAWVADLMATMDNPGCSSATDIDLHFTESGSTVAVYTINVVNATFTLSDITTALANQVNITTAMGAVISSGDYDECAGNFTLFRNCSEFAQCLNGVGSFSCACNSTYYDNSTGLAGTVCINPVIVTCDQSGVNASILTDFYTEFNINLTDLHLNDYYCNRTSHAKIIGDTLQFEFLQNDCNTTLTANGSHVILENEISNAPLATSSSAFTGSTIHVPVQCVLPDTTNSTINFTGTIDKIVLPATASIGNFTVLYQLYTDDTYTTLQAAGKTYGSAEMLYNKISIANSIGAASILVKNCWGTAYSGPNSQPQQKYIDATCPTSFIQNFVTTNNGNGDAKFQHQAFFFPVTSSVYLHCEVEVCAGTCLGSGACTKRRRRRDAELDSGNERGNITIIINMTPGDSISEEGLRTIIHSNNITISVIAGVLGLILLILLALVVVFIVRKNRAQKENYDLTHINMHAIDGKPPVYT